MATKRKRRAKKHTAPKAKSLYARWCTARRAAGKNIVSKRYWKKAMLRQASGNTHD